LLCAAAQKALDSGRVSSDGFIELEASGGKCFQKDVSRFLEQWSEAEMDALLIKLKFNNFLHINVKDKAHALCYYHENQRLVAYYQKNYGLQPINESDPYATIMKGKISNCINKCSGIQSLGKRRKLKSKQIKKSKCKCWAGYERVKGTMPCAKKSCKKIK